MRRLHFVFAILGVLVVLNVVSTAQIKIEVQGGKASSAPPVRVRVSSGVSTGLLIKKVTPNYPQLAKQARIQGQVVLRAEISKEGTIQSLQLISGHPLLAPTAIAAVKQWQYKPYNLKGEPVEVETQIVVNFALSGSDEQTKGQAATAQTSAPQPLTLPQITGKFDKFKNVTSFVSERTHTGSVTFDGGKSAWPMVRSMDIIAGFACRGQLSLGCPTSASSGFLLFTATTSNWHFSDNRELILLIDGEPLKVGAMTWDGKVLEADDLREYLNIDFSPTLLIKLAKAKTVEVQVGVFEFPFTEENLAVFKELNVHLLWQEGHR